QQTTDATRISKAWSGGVVFAPSGKVINWVHAEWTVPNVDPVADDGSWSLCSSWIGIDGEGSPDALGVGILYQVRSLGGGHVERFLFPYWEWSPEAAVAIENFPVAAGDVVTGTICVEGRSATKATVIFTNQTQGTFTSFEVSAPTGTALRGNCAEWIVSRTSVDGTLQP